MGIPGYVPYKRREYCRDIQCPIQHQLEKHEPGTDEYEQVRRLCKTECIHTTYEFHHWLIDHGYEIVRPEGAAKAPDGDLATPGRSRPSKPGTGKEDRS